MSTRTGGVGDRGPAGELGRPLYALVSLFRFPYRPGSGEWRYDSARPLGLSTFLSYLKNTTGALYAFCVLVLLPASRCSSSSSGASSRA